MPRVLLLCCLLLGFPSLAAAQGPSPAGPADLLVPPAAPPAEEPFAEGPLQSPALLPPDPPGGPAAPGGGGSLDTTGALGPGGGPGGFDPRVLAVPSIRFGETWFSTEKVEGQSAHLGYLQSDLAVNAPLYHDGGDVWALTFRGRSETFSTQAVLPGSNRRFPEDLWSLNFGTTYAHTFDNGWVLGGAVSVGSASDKPFHSIDEMTAGVNAFLRIPSGERNAWLFGLAYSPTSEVPFPIPMAAYIYNPSDYLRVNIGLPFQVMYRPTEDLTLNFSYMLLRTVHAQASYRLCQQVRAHVGFDWGNESYFLADRANVNDRLFYYDKRISTGLLFNVARNFTLDFTGGYVFDRFYFEGAQYADHSSNQLDVGNGFYLSVQGRLRW